MKQKISVGGELERLRAENMKLKAENSRLIKKSQVAKKNKKTKRNGLGRSLGVIALVVIAAAILTAGNILFWTGNTIVKQDRFVAATAPIIKDPQVQQTMALYATNNIFNNVDVQQITESVLPPRADFLAPQLTAQLKTGTQKILQTALAKPELQDKWNSVSARQHDRLINFATNYEGNGDISVNEVFNQLSTKLKDTKLSFLADKQLPPKVGDVTVVNATWLPAFHKLITNIDTWRLLAVIVLILSVVGAVWLSRNRRRTIYIFSWVAGGFMLASLISLRIIRETVAEKADPQYEQGVRNVMQIVFHSLVLQTVTILLAILLLGFITWISSTSNGAMAVKNKFALLFSGKLHDQLFGKSKNKYVLWTRRNKRQLEWSILGLFTAVLLIVRLTPGALFTYSLLLLISITTIEIISGQPDKK
jgi:hypothetical protein